jgi:hypothetical protein
MMDADKKRLFVETTIPSLATARSSSDVITAGRQASTKLFWETERQKYDLFVSQDVLDECRLGNPDAAERRIQFLFGIPVLPKTKEVVELAVEYQSLLGIPDKAKMDSLHLAICVISEMDYLLSWNFSHLGIKSYEKMRGYNEMRGLWTPFLVAPDALIVVTEET